MPTIFSERGYRFYFYEADLDEPMHVHITKSGREAKIWVESMRVASAGGFKSHELNEIERIIEEHYGKIVAAWKREKDKRINR
jgi:hypothetical protein